MRAKPPVISEASKLYLCCSCCCILVPWQSTEDDAQQGTAEINICGRSDGRSVAAIVHCSLFMVLCLNFMLFRVSSGYALWVVKSALDYLRDYLKCFLGR